MKLPIMWRKYKESLRGRCQLCGENCKKGTSLQLDHDHVTEMARGFVCSECNRYAIMAGETKPALVSETVLIYLNNPPLKGFNLVVKNRKIDKLDPKNWEYSPFDMLLP